MHPLSMEANVFHVGHSCNLSQRAALHVFQPNLDGSVVSHVLFPKIEGPQHGPRNARILSVGDPQKVPQYWETLSHITPRMIFKGTPNFECVLLEDFLLSLGAGLSPRDEKLPKATLYV